MQGGLLTKTIFWLTCNRSISRTSYVTALTMSSVMVTSFEHWSGLHRLRLLLPDDVVRGYESTSGVSRWSQLAFALPGLYRFAFPKEIVVASLMALFPEVNWDGFKWPMIEDLLVDDSHFQWLNYMQNRPDWDGHSFGPRLVGPLERTAIAMSGLQQSGAAAAAKALPPIPFGEGEDRHFELALELQQRPTPFKAMGVVDDDLIFAAAGCTAQRGQTSGCTTARGTLASGVRPPDVAYHSPFGVISSSGHQIGYARAPHCTHRTGHALHWLA